MHIHKIYNTQSKSDRLFSTQSRALLFDYLILAKNEKATLNINILSPNHMLSLTEFFWDFQNNALWDTHYHAQLVIEQKTFYRM